jgi:hypothetical protein
MAKGTTRHLKYVWIEYLNSLDGEAFTQGLSRMGWQNLLSSLPVKNDGWGQRRVDSAHPLLPIRVRGSSLLALPNEREEAGRHIRDPIFLDYCKAHGDSKFVDEIIKQNEFICKWVFSPGLRKNSHAT